MALHSKMTLYIGVTPLSQREWYTARSPSTHSYEFGNYHYKGGKNESADFVGAEPSV